MILQDLVKKNIAHPPKWLPDNTHYLAIVGSESYGANIGNSDKDIQGFCMPPKEMIFPHLRGEILDFGEQHQRFQDWQQHHIMDVNRDQEYDFAVYSIVRFFHLAMENNPNILDIISVPPRCVVHITSIGQLVRDNRKLFYHAGCFHNFRGYAFSSLNKIGRRDSVELSKFCAEKNISESISYKAVIDEIQKREALKRRVDPIINEWKI